MEKNVFIEKLLKAALEDGIEAAEVYTSDHDSFRAMSTTGEITDYAVSSRSGLSLRGIMARWATLPLKPTMTMRLPC